MVDGGVAELVDASDSKSGSLGSESSILSGPTIRNEKHSQECFLQMQYIYINRKHDGV